MILATNEFCLSGYAIGSYKLVNKKAMNSESRRTERLSSFNFLRKKGPQ
ncbi:MAG: hypothetical protein ACJARG_001908, partial [Arcticibacterium sp.]